MMSELPKYHLVRMTERQVRTLGYQLSQGFMNCFLEDHAVEYRPGSEDDQHEWERLVYDLRSILMNMEEGVDVNDS